MAGPLAGVRVIDLSAMLSGPWAADILGDQGADVIKVEPPGSGDHVRDMGNQSGGMPAMLLNINRSKRSVTLNLKSAEGVGVLRNLVATADVVVQNFRPDVVERLGIGYDDLVPVNEKLIYLSLSGFGERGPLAHHRVYDPIIQAISGLTTVQAASDRQRPRLIRTVLPDKLTAILASQAVTAALLARERTGEGQHIRLSMLDGVLSFLWATDMGAYTFVGREVPLAEDGSFRDLIYETADGWITVGTNTNAEWEALCTAVGRPEWIEDERFATPGGRSRYINERLDLVQSAVVEQQTEYWLEVMENHGVPVAPALKRSEVIEHPQVLASEIMVESEHPVAGRLRQARPAARFSGTPVDPPRGAPLLGQHNHEVLAEAGLDSDEIDRLVAAGVVGAERYAPGPASPEAADAALTRGA